MHKLAKKEMRGVTGANLPLSKVARTVVLHADDQELALLPTKRHCELSFRGERAQSSTSGAYPVVLWVVLVR
jgi:hypothetical protein